MKKIFSRRYFLFSLFLLLGGAFFALPVEAVCPLCTVAVGVGIGFSRWLGIDDSITGLWIGGFVVSLIEWTLNWLEKKKYNFRGAGIVVTIGYYLLIVAPLYSMHMLGNFFSIPYFTWLDKLLLGIIVGSLAFYTGAQWHYFLKEKNNGKVYFSFQKVILPVGSLLLISIIYYFLTLK